MATGHVLDANTLALFRMDETALGGNALLLDAGPNGRNCIDINIYSNVCPGPRVYQGPVSGRTQGCLARRAKTNTATFQCNTNTGSDATALQGNWTFKAWVFVDSATVALIAYLAGGDSTATNYQIGFNVTSAGQITSFWEFGAVGTDVSVGSATGIVPLGVWAHVAVIKDDDPVNSGKKRLTYVVDGVNKGSSSNLTNSTGGTSCIWQIGVGPFTFRSMMVTSNVNSVATLAADAANTSGPNAYTHTDSNVIVHWKCDELPDLWDEAGNYHLRKLAGAPPGNALTGSLIGTDPLLSDGGYSQFFDGATKYQSSTFGNEPLRQAFMNSITIECLLRIGTDDPLGGIRGFICFGNPGVESSADNYFAIDILTNGTIQIDVEHGAGVNASTASPSAIFTATNKYGLHHLAIVIQISAGQTVFDVYLDKVKIGSTSSGIVPMDGGTNNVLQVAVGNGNTSNLFHGWIDELRISNVARSLSEIEATYDAALGPTPPPDPVTVYVPIEQWL